MTGLLAVFEPDQARREALIDGRWRWRAGSATKPRSPGCIPSAVIVNWRPERAH